MTDADSIKTKLLRNGRAMVQVVEGLEILKEDAGSWRETVLINLTQDLYSHRLERALASVPREVREEILKTTKSDQRAESCRG